MAARMSRPAVTVLMPVRDGARHLPEALDSILRQTWRDLECVVCDDGSADATPEILARAAAADGRLRVLRLPRAGIVAALNAGLAAARADWVARMDADDIAAPDRLEHQMAAAAHHPGSAAIGGAWRVVGPDGRFRRRIAPPLEPAEIAEALLRHNPLAHPTMLLRRDAVVELGGYRAAFRSAEDYDLWLRLAERHPIRCVPNTLIDYREHAGQTAWAEIAHRVHAELGARAAAQARRAGLPDPAEGVDAIDAAWLRAAGVTEAEIVATMTSRALGTALDAVAAGQGPAVRAALRLLRAQPGLRPRTRAHAAVLWLHSLMPGRRQ
jgi:glycosyltransferase involved in cell wall biosynthesis